MKSRLLYGGEVWWTSKKELGRLERAQNDFTRWISGHTRRNRVSTENQRREVDIEDSLCIQLEWLGRLARMGGDRLVSRVWGAQCEGKRARGRPRWMFDKQEAEDLARGGVHRLDALDKEKWKKAVKEIKRPQ